MLAGSARTEVHFVNQVGSTVYQFVRLFTDVGGTAPSINFTAFIAKD